MLPQSMLGDYRGCDCGAPLSAKYLLELLISIGRPSFWGLPLKSQMIQSE